MEILNGTSSDPYVIQIENNYPYGTATQPSQLSFWLQSSLRRVYPKSPPGGGQLLELVSPRNARLSFQACLHNNGLLPIDVTCEVEGKEGIQVQVRRVGWVPQAYVSHNTPLDELEGSDYIPGLVPDPLFPETHAKVWPFSNQCFWITVRVSADITPGIYSLKVVFKSTRFNQDAVLNAAIDIRPPVLKPHENFPVTHWWFPDCIYDWNKQDRFGDEFFQGVRAYLQNLLDHGNNVIYMPILNYRREIMERPPQLLQVKELEPGKYEFNWDWVRKIVRMAQELGFDYYEWTHLWAYSHNKDRAASAATPTGIYTERNGKLELLFPEEMDGGGEEYRNFLSQFLPEFKRFLSEEGILENSLFHISDEPSDSPEDMENYRRAREILKQIAPDIKVMDAVFSEAYAVEGLTDYPVPIAHGADNYVEKGIPHWVYYCCSPLGPYINRFFDTPLYKIRMQGWVFYKLRTLGFLHWGYNFWYIFNGGFDPESQELLDPFTDGSGKHRLPYGDAFVVYPGQEGPIDSIRWELFAESMQDYALLQTLDINPDDEMLQSIINYREFPKSEQWLQKTYRQLLDS
jgi:hypothetical protein